MTAKDFAIEVFAIVLAIVIADWITSSIAKARAVSA